jgi:uncharacterized membrane-anchored protein YjiN (DUF445 family)
MVQQAVDPTTSAPAAATGPRSVPTAAGAEAARRRDLRRMQMWALGLLLFAAAVYVVARQAEDERPWAGYVRATAEAAMVGGLADWFAVTALFRRPLGLPIPHTALIPTRKDALGRSLGSFVEENFLAPETVTERLAAARVVARVGNWLTAPGSAATVSRHAATAIAGAADVLRDDEVQTALESAIVNRVRRVPAAPLAGRLVEIATDEGRHEALVDAGIKGAQQFLEGNRALIRSRFGRESPWWVPEAVDDRIFSKLFSGLEGFLAELAGNPEHELRRALDERIAGLAERLQHDPALIAQGERWKEELLDHPAVRAWTASLWGDLKATLQRQSADPGSELRRRLEAAALQLGRTLQADPGLRDKLDRWLERVVRYVVDQERHQVADLIATTVERWDPQEASRRIETQVGRDLQFIRINGTVVGGIAGLAIHTVGRLIA